jgi:Na+/phosphate symporter
MRALSGGSFRNLVRGLTDSPWLTALCGLFAGALMQSATVVTFILVSMLDSGIIQSAATRLLLLWCHVGLTAFAFLAAVNISPRLLNFQWGRNPNGSGANKTLEHLCGSFSWSR